MICVCVRYRRMQHVTSRIHAIATRTLGAFVDRRVGTGTLRALRASKWRWDHRWGVFSAPPQGHPGPLARECQTSSIVSVLYPGGLKGSATKGQFRKCGLTAVHQIMTQQKQGEGAQEGSGIRKNTFSNWPFAVDPQFPVGLRRRIRDSGAARPRQRKGSRTEWRALPGDANTWLE